jgi:hypothetical protein
MKLILRLIGLAFLVFVLIQFIRPALTHPPVTAEIQAPPEVRAVLKRSCYSCHSNETALPWFDQVAPAYWLVTHDVKVARQHLNFSEIGSKPAAAQRAMLFEAVNQIQLGAMPLPRYLKAHPDAALTSADLAVLRNYLGPFHAIPVPNAKLAALADEQYKGWTAAGATLSAPTRTVKPSLNGIAFFPDYKDWKVISTTDRGDNHTLRVITGNDIAIKAVADKNIHPWPDGAVFAKIAWDAVADDKGVLHAGQFLQVEFMVKDKAKYAATEGWGFARWKTMDLVPYGKDADFAGECVSCHRPVKSNDYVYTMPIERKGQ